MLTNRAEFSVYVDWDGDGFYCTGSQISDGLNLVPTPLTWANIDVNGLSIIKVAEATAYGQTKADIQLSTSTTSGADLGKDSGGTINDIPATAGNVYTGVLWMKGIANYSGIDMQLRIL